MNAPLPQFKAIAEKMVSMGGHVHPVATGEKALTVPNWQNNATRDESVIATWAEENPHYNVAVVGKSDGLWLFDDDQNVLAEYENAHGAITTYRVRSVSGGTHLYFKQNDASRKMGNISGKNDQGQETWSARVHNRYVISAGSVAHPDNDREQPLAYYQAIDLAGPVEAPDSFIEFLKQKAAIKQAAPAAAVVGGMVLEGGRNSYLFQKGVTLRHAGAELSEIEPILFRMNVEMCSPPLADSEVRTIATSAARYEQDRVLLSNGRPFGVSTPPQEADITNWRQQFRAVGELEKGDVRMLINNFLPEGTTFIGGLPGEGKTLFALSMAKALTTGNDFLGDVRFDVPRAVPCLYLIPEVAARAFRQRCEKFHIPDDPNLFLCRTISEGATLLLDNPIVLEAVKRMRPVVFLDTVLRFNEAEDENAASQNKALVEDLIRLRHAGAVSIVGLHHSTKNMHKEGMSLETALRGTGDLAACCDAVYGLLRDEPLYDHNRGPNEIEVACVKPRDFEPPAPFRIAASRRADKPTVIGTVLGIVSNIDDFGDFLAVSEFESQKALGDMLGKLVTDDPAITLAELAKATKISIWVIRQALKREGWTKTRGGTKGATQWTRGSSFAPKAATTGSGGSRTNVVTFDAA
jgi:hypothetical protein